MCPQEGPIIECRILLTIQFSCKSHIRKLAERLPAVGWAIQEEKLHFASHQTLALLACYLLLFHHHLKISNNLVAHFPHLYKAKCLYVCSHSAYAVTERSTQFRSYSGGKGRTCSLPWGGKSCERAQASVWWEANLTFSQNFPTTKCGFPWLVSHNLGSFLNTSFKT